MKLVPKKIKNSAKKIIKNKKKKQNKEKKTNQVDWICSNRVCLWRDCHRRDIAQAISHVITKKGD